MSEDFQFRLTSRVLFAEANAPLVVLQHRYRSRVNHDVEAKCERREYICQSKGKLFKRAKYFENAKPVSRWSVEYLSTLSHKIGYHVQQKNQAGIDPFESITFPF